MHPHEKLITLTTGKINLYDNHDYQNLNLLREDVYAHINSK